MKKLMTEWKKFLNEQEEEVLDSVAEYIPPKPANEKCDEKSVLYAKRGFDINPTKFLGNLDKALDMAIELKTYTGRYPEDGVQELNNWPLFTYIPGLLRGSDCFSPQPTKEQMDQKLGDLYTMLTEAEKMMAQKAPETLRTDKILNRMYLNMEYLINAIATARYGNPKTKREEIKKVLSKLKPIQMTNN
mgnify:CR=1 FL=1